MAVQKINRLNVEAISRNSARHFLTRDLQNLGHLAWSNQLPHRSAQEIDAIYPAATAHEDFVRLFTDLDKADRSLRMREYGRGALFVARSPDVLDEDGGSRILGYAVMRNNVSGTPVERAVKTYLNRRPPYVWLQSINVHPDYQRKGIGSSLIMAGAQEFDYDQPTTAYVYDENPGALELFKTLGYEKIGAAPRLIDDRFGAGTAPAEQWALRAWNIGGVAALASDIVASKDLHVALRGIR